MNALHRNALHRIALHRTVRHEGHRSVRRAAVGLAVAATLATSACAAGQLAETAQEKPTLDGTSANIGSIAVRGLAIETPDADTYPVGSSLQLIAVFVNDGKTADRLTGISSTYAKTWGTFASASAFTAAAGSTAATSPATAPVELPSGLAVSYGVPVADGRILALLDTTKVVRPGTTIPVTFTLQNGGSETVPVPIRISADSAFTPAPSVLPSGPSEGGS